MPAGATLNYGFRARSADSSAGFVWDGDSVAVVDADSAITRVAPPLSDGLVSVTEGQLVERTVRYRAPAAGEER